MNENINNLKIFVVFFKDIKILDIFKNNKNIFIPIHCGRENYSGNSNFLLSMIGDNTGKNISKYNNSICELTSIYWIYNNLNIDTEFIGLNHYRRFFDIEYDKLYKNTIIAFVNPLKTTISYQFNNSHNNRIKTVSYKFLEYLFSDYQFQKYKNEFLDYFNNEKILYICNMFIMETKIFKNYYGKIIVNILDILIKFINLYNITLELKLFSYILERLGSFIIYKLSKDLNLKIIDGNGTFVNL